MSDMGVLKTKNGSSIFNTRLSWSIYTPTEILRIIEKISTLWHFILNLTNIAPNIVKPHKKSTLSPITHPIPNSKFKSLSSYINKKIQRKSILLPINSFAPKSSLIFNSNMEINYYIDAYKSEFNIDTNPYAIDAINNYKDIKDMFTLTLDSIMNKLNL